MFKIKKIAQKVDASNFEFYPIGVDAENVDLKSGLSLEEELENIRSGEGGGGSAADKVPKDHASETKEYGVGTDKLYGHVKISSDYDSSSDPDNTAISITGAKKLIEIKSDVDIDIEPNDEGYTLVIEEDGTGGGGGGSETNPGTNTGGNYVLPLASSTTRGGVKTGYTQNEKNYPVQLSSEKMFVNVPWTDTTYSAATQSADGLMSADDKKKLDGLSSSGGSSSYTLPVATNSTLGGVKVGYTTAAGSRNYGVQLTSNNQMYVNVPWSDTNTTYSNATQSEAGLMSAADKKKLDGLSSSSGSGGSSYILPTASKTTLGGVKIGYSQSGKNYPVELNTSNQMYVNVPWTNTTYSVATKSANGLMSSSDKTKLDELSMPNVTNIYNADGITLRKYGKVYCLNLNNASKTAVDLNLVSVSPPNIYITLVVNVSGKYYPGAYNLKTSSFLYYPTVGSAPTSAPTTATMFGNISWIIT